MINWTKTSLFDSKLIISAPARISAPGFSGIYVVFMSLSACMMSWMWEFTDLLEELRKNRVGTLAVISYVTTERHL